MANHAWSPNGEGSPASDVLLVAPIVFAAARGWRAWTVHQSRCEPIVSGWGQCRDNGGGSSCRGIFRATNLENPPGTPYNPHIGGFESNRAYQSPFPRSTTDAAACPGGILQ